MIYFLDIAMDTFSLLFGSYIATKVLYIKIYYINPNKAQLQSRGIK